MGQGYEVILIFTAHGTDGTENGGESSEEGDLHHVRKRDSEWAGAMIAKV